MPEFAPPPFSFVIIALSKYDYGIPILQRKLVSMLCLVIKNSVDLTIVHDSQFLLNTWVSKRRLSFCHINAFNYRSWNLWWRGYLLYKYSEHPSKPSSSSSHFSAAVSWSERVVAKIQAPCSTKNLTMDRLLQLAAQCNGVLCEKFDIYISFETSDTD